MKNIEELPYKLERNSNSPLSKLMLKASPLNVHGDKFPYTLYKHRSKYYPADIWACACANYCTWLVASEMRHVLFEKALAGKCCDNVCRVQRRQKERKSRHNHRERECITVCRIILAR